MQSTPRPARAQQHAACVPHTGSRQVFRLWASQSWQPFPSKSVQDPPSGPTHALSSRTSQGQDRTPITAARPRWNWRISRKKSAAPHFPFHPGNTQAPGTRSAYHNARAASRGEPKKREPGPVAVRLQHRDTEIRRKRRRCDDRSKPSSSPLPPELCVSVLKSNHLQSRTAYAPPAPPAP
jgi:hypothetical protein